MSEEKDFEQTWLTKFSDAITEITGKDITEEVMHALFVGITITSNL